MAYNREWDRGKDSWNDNSWNDSSWQGDSRQDHSSWNEYSSGHAQGKDEEYYGEGKRRKFNNGGYRNSQAYESGGYEDYTVSHPGQSGSHEYTDDRHHGAGGGHHKKRMVPSEPSPHVIFLGLDPDFTEADFQAYLTGQSCTVESVTIIRDRTSGVSKGFGFAQFASIDQARAFVDPRFPFIQMPPPASHGASAKATFNKALESGQPHNGRRIKIDYSQSANPSDRRRGPLNLNDGTRDIGNTQAPVLLFRGLDPLSGPQAIAQAMKNSSGVGKEGAKGMKRIILIKDKTTMASWGFAFVEFIDVQSAAAVLGATMSAQLHPSGFRISERPVAASFAHPYSFQPLPDYSLRDDACLPSSTSLGGAEGTMVRYWDEGSTVAVLEFKVEEPAQPTEAAPVTKEKKKKVKADDITNKPVEASTLPVSDKPVTLSFKGGFGQKQTLLPAAAQAAVKKPVAVLGFSMADEDAAGEGSEDHDNLLPSDAKVFTAKKVAPMVASKKTVNNINKWNQVQEDMKEGGETAVPVPPVPVEVPPPVKPVVQVKVVQAKEKSSTPIPTAEPDLEFADPTGMSCLLCSRKFASLEQLKRHNKESDLHKRNYKDANLREVAREKAKAAKAKAEQPKYRDRASERRIMHNQPDIPLPESSSSAAAKPGNSKKRFAEGPPPPASPPPPPVNPGEDQKNVGNKLLRMMGWTEGTGLGQAGEGRVEPIQTAIYAAGVGLGASKGKELGKYTEGYSGYVHMAQDSARERYGS
ncbi:hypothetical protein BDW22DRAFT_1414817 [Trametopsis cervina]|nr:hypothetical protein BDW22DRAFT_1414817 [Trametopsis cervina]